MTRFLKLLRNPTWYRQLLYGLIVAFVFGGLTFVSGFHLAFALIQVAFVAGIKESYLESLTGEFNWRNFILFQFPALFIYIIITL